MIPVTSNFTNYEEDERGAKRKYLMQLALASFTPFIALFVQLKIWSIVSPFFWFAFYPAVLLSAWLAGFTGGIISTILSATLCWYFFILPEITFAAVATKYFITSSIFILMGFLISVLNGRLKRTIKMQNRAKAKLLRRDVQLSEAQRIGKFGSWAWDIEQNHIEWSEETYRIFGYDSRSFQITLESFYDRVHPQDRKLVENGITETLSKSKPYDLEFRICLPDGTEKFIHSKADVRILNGRPIEMIGTVHDITERKLAEEALKDSEEKFRGLLETACDPIIVVDSKGIIEFANHETKSTLGYDPSEIVGKPVELLVPERFKSSHIGQRMGYMQHPTSRPMGRNIQLSARKKNGTDLPVDISLSPFETKRGTVVTAFMRDMSERRRVEARERFLFDTTRVLSETLSYEERIRSIAELVVPPLADVCLVYIQEDGRLILKAVAHKKSLNPSLIQQVFQIGSSPKKSLRFGPAFVADSGTNQLIEVVTDEYFKSMANEDLSNLEKIRSVGIQSLISVPMHARGRNIGVISFIRCKPLSYTKDDLDFTNLVADRAALAVDNARLYHEAQKAVQLREDVLAIVSHDLKNPLSIVRGFNEVIAESCGESGDSGYNKEATGAIARSVRQMERLINDLLDFAKIQSGTLAIETIDCQVQNLISSSLENVKHFADKKHLSVQIEIQPEIPDVLCDPDRIGQVLSNIIGNAIKFSPDNGVLKVKARKKLSEVEFVITDNGNGIPPENLEHIFERYWQAKESAKLGFGLGLSIAKGIIESHHGKIWAESEVGNGTTFHFTLPIWKTGSAQGPVETDVYRKSFI